MEKDRRVEKTDKHTRENEDYIRRHTEEGISNRRDESGGKTDR